MLLKPGMDTFSYGHLLDIYVKTIMDYRDEADSLSDTLDPLNLTPKERSISGLIVASSALFTYNKNLTIVILTM